MAREVFEPMVYVVASGFRGTLYVGSTSNPMQRIHQHREGLIPGFTRRYGIRRLVHFEVYAEMEAAIGRERQIKEWKRAWKVELIEQQNPHWNDLAIRWGFAPLPA